ncbi:MAG: hypothetical protein N2D54_07845, partial [Chloroflexota bacterium]
DGGRLYSDRRQAQSVSDNAAFAASSVIARNKLNSTNGTGVAGWTNSTLYKRAKRAANELLLDNGYGASDSNVSNLSVTLTRETDLGTYYEIIIEFDSTIPPTLIQVVYDGNLVSHSYAKVHIRPKVNIGFGYGMFSTSMSECDALKITGSNTTTITDTGVYVASDGEDGSCDASTYGGSADIYIEEDYTVSGTVQANGSGGTFVVGGGVNTNAPQQEIPYVPTPDCSGLPPGTYSAITHTYTPGIYPAGISITGSAVTYTFNSGIYCITGNVKFNTGIINGSDILLYLVNGDFDANGTEINLAAAPKGVNVDASGNDWGGMVIYSDINNGQPLTFAGNAGSNFEGTVFAPSSLCTIVGNSDTDGFSTQLICNMIVLNGSSDLYINLDAATYYEPPATLDMIE